MSPKAYVKKHTFMQVFMNVDTSVNQKGVVKGFFRSFTTPLYQNQLELIKLSNSSSTDWSTSPIVSYVRTPHPYSEGRSCPTVLVYTPRTASYPSVRNARGNGEYRSANHKLRNYKDRNDSLIDLPVDNGRDSAYQLILLHILV